jgi:hypothetical protein
MGGVGAKMWARVLKMSRGRVWGLETAVWVLKNM